MMSPSSSSAKAYSVAALSVKSSCERSVTQVPDLSAFVFHMYPSGREWEGRLSVEMYAVSDLSEVPLPLNVILYTSNL